MQENNKFEVIIIGGSYAGLSAAMALGRSLRSVLIIDGGQPCNIQTPHSHNFITQDGETPAAIAAKARQSAALMAVMGFPLIIPQLILLLKISNAAFAQVQEGYWFMIVVLLALSAMVVILSAILFPFLWKD